ncbi:MAG: hypothetical protein HC929_02235 [Leptolyngbyaceae cyanobacterium SM2_5_2]|nr:hypothetical protein [Leptolyngbyaceae cyanobacterium SM2_5_2]
MAQALAKSGWISSIRPYVRNASIGLVSAIAMGILAGPQPAQGQGYDVVPPLPAGVIPVPGSAVPQAPVGGQQYVVFVNGSSEELLNQVRMVEPTAFRTTFQGQTVIQAGRFSYSTNAQQRVADLAAQGVTAQMAEAPAAQPYYAQTPVAPGNVYASNGQLPPLPGVTVIPPQTATGLPALPPPTQIPPTQMPPTQMTPMQVPPNTGGGNVEFGQQLSYAAPATPNAYPVNVPPPTGTALATPGIPSETRPTMMVIPTATANLQTVANQVIQMGTPADRVQARTEPRGPHVAVGPFADRGLAERWNSFYREAGLSDSRVFYQR